jgi:hypothetical protein
MTNILQCDFPTNLKVISSVAQIKVLTLPSRYLAIRIGPPEEEEAQTAANRN